MTAKSLQPEQTDAKSLERARAHAIGKEYEALMQDILRGDIDLREHGEELYRSYAEGMYTIGLRAANSGRALCAVLLECGMPADIFDHEREEPGRMLAHSPAARMHALGEEGIVAASLIEARNHAITSDKHMKQLMAEEDARRGLVFDPDALRAADMLPDVSLTASLTLHDGRVITPSEAKKEQQLSALAV